MASQCPSPWPTLDAGYEDEFGAIDPRVYDAAGRIWPQADRLGERILNDSHLAQTLLLKASAAVSATPAAEAGAVRSLEAYLMVAFRRLVAAEARRAGHRRAAERSLPEPPAPDPAAALERRILLGELEARMEPWCRHVARLLLEGLSFHEVSLRLGIDPSWVRRRFARRMARLVRMRTSRRAESRVPAAIRAPARRCRCRASDPAR